MWFYVHQVSYATCKSGIRQVSVPHKQWFKEYSEEEIPPSLYFDTSFIVSALIEGEKYHKKTVSFIDSLACAKQQPVIVFSELLHTELRCAVIAICIRNKFGKDTKINKIIFNDPDIIKRYYPQVKEAEEGLNGILQRFVNWISVPVTEKITAKAGEVMPAFRLGSQDAVHVATMLDWDIINIAAYDWGIEELPRYKGGVHIWTVNGAARYEKRRLKSNKK
jgi:predicted nucleic acid-binding protein